MEDTFYLLMLRLLSDSKKFEAFKDCLLQLPESIKDNPEIGRLLSCPNYDDLDLFKDSFTSLNEIQQHIIIKLIMHLKHNGQIDGAIRVIQQYIKTKEEENID
ncbi:MAG: hypothetical protein J6T38_10660 [Bacteroidaceae bacterium]|nr:hypothetical protein [Bacteroidaceae bacterium]